MYVFGGEHEPRVPIGSTVHRLDLQTKEWSACRAINEDSKPVPVNAATVCSIGDVIYIFGGRSGLTEDEGPTNDMYSFNTKSNKWSKLETSGDHPLARSYHAMAALDNKLYVFGGCAENSRMNDLYSFDVTCNRWEKQPNHDVMEARGGAGLVAVGVCVYVIAGFNGREMNDVHKFDTVTKLWTTMSFQKSLPPRSVFGNVTDGTNIVVICGEIDPSDQGHQGAGNFSNECFILNTIEPLEWVRVSVTGGVPEPRGWFPAAYCPIDKRFIIFGGNSDTNARLNDTYMLEMT